LVGGPTGGNSRLLTALVGRSRPFASAVPGPSRDLMTEVVDVDGLCVTLVDTAGLRDTQDPVEIEGVERSRQAVAVSDLILVIVVRSQARPALVEFSTHQGSKRLIVTNT